MVLGLAVSHAGGLTHACPCVCLGVGVLTVLGPLEARFVFVLIQTTQLDKIYARLVSTKAKPAYA